MKRIPELHRLSTDHHLGLVLARRACLAAEGKVNYSPSDVWSEIDRKFRRELEPHFMIEEEYLSPPMKAIGELELIERFNDDHKTLREIVLNHSVHTNSALKKFGELLEKHIRFEERELFEVAQQLLSSEQLKTINEACRNGTKAKTKIRSE